MTSGGTISGLIGGCKQNPWLGERPLIPRRIKQLRRRRHLGVLIVIALALLACHFAWGGA